MKLSELRMWKRELHRRYPFSSDDQTLRDLFASSSVGQEDIGRFRIWFEKITTFSIEICEHCGEISFASNMSRTNRSGGELVCIKCLDDNFIYSDRIDIYVHQDDWNSRIHEYEEDYDYDDYDDENGDEDYSEDEIHDYSADVTRSLSFRSHKNERTNDQTLYLGIELEVERRRDCPRNITKMVLDQLGRDYVILKYDSSLSSGGFEIVTAPATLAFHQENWDGFFHNENGAWHHLKGFRTTTAGMHVHMSRAAFTPLNLSKMMVFYNMADNRSFIERIAGREYSEMRQWAKLKPDMNLKIAKYGDGDRYSACNLSTKGGNTVEIRIFRSNVSRLGFFKNLEFVDAAYHFACQTSMKKLHHNDFLKWLNDPKNICRYANLAMWLAQASLIKLSRPLLSARSKRLTAEEAA